MPCSSSNEVDGEGQDWGQESPVAQDYDSFPKKGNVSDLEIFQTAEVPSSKALNPKDCSGFHPRDVRVGDEANVSSRRASRAGSRHSRLTSPQEKNNFMFFFMYVYILPVCLCKYVQKIFIIL